MKIWPYAMLLCTCLAGTSVQGQTSRSATANTATPRKTAVFNIGLDDTSLQGQEQGPQAAQQERLRALDAQLRDALVKSGCCQIVPLGAAAKQAPDFDAWNCNGCDVDLARKAGATISVTGWVQKVSNLILNINVVARNISTGQVIAAGSVDIRGNTDESWSRGLAYLLRERLHPSKW